MAHGRMPMEDQINASVRRPRLLQDGRDLWHRWRLKIASLVRYLRRESTSRPTKWDGDAHNGGPRSVLKHPPFQSNLIVEHQAFSPDRLDHLPCDVVTCSQALPHIHGRDESGRWVRADDQYRSLFNPDPSPFPNIFFSTSHFGPYSICY